MSVVETRRSHLLVAIDEQGGIPALSAALGVTPAYIHNLKQGRRNVGHSTARKIEELMGWPEGQMDVPPVEVNAELRQWLQTLPEDQILDALKEVLPNLSERGTAAVLHYVANLVGAKPQEEEPDPNR